MSAWQWFGVLAIAALSEVGCYLALGRDRKALGMMHLILGLAITLVAAAAGLIMIVWGKWVPW